MEQRAVRPVVFDTPYPTHRRPTLARNVVSTSQPLAAQAGLRMLLDGGNAVDAALATAITLTVVEPVSNGIGSDLFAIIWDGKKLHGLNASGRSPAAWTPEYFKGRSSMPARGWDSVSVPGAVSAFGVFWLRQVIIGSIPDELIDAAKADGCSVFRIYRSIVVPNIRGSAAVFGLFAAMATWNDFLWPLVVLNTPDMFTSQVAIQQLRTQYTIDYSTVMTASVLATLPLLLLFAVAGKQLVAGIMEGAVKG